MSIKAPSSLPLMLLAKVQLRDGDKSVDGVYAIAWTPDRFRRVYRFPNFSETDVMVDRTIYRQRNINAMPLLIFELENLIDFDRIPLSDHKIRSVETDKSPPNRSCISVAQEITKTKICMDSVTLLPASIDRIQDARGLEALREHFEFAGYQAIGTKQFPRTLKFHGWNSRSVEVHIDKIMNVESFPPDEFTPPANSARMHYCAKSESTGELKPSTGNVIPFGMSDMEVAMYFQVSPMGGVRNAEVVYSTNPLKNKEILNWFVGTHFPVRSCSGSPIEYETIVTLATGH